MTLPWLDQLIKTVTTPDIRTVKYQCCAIPSGDRWSWWIKIRDLQVKLTPQDNITFNTKQDARENMAFVIDQIGWEVPASLK